MAWEDGVELIIDEDFRVICLEIFDRLDRIGRGRLVWSDDEYQRGAFCGGWDPELERFAFSFYASDGGDYIFQFTVEDARVVAKGGTIEPRLEYWKQAPSW